MLSYTLYIDKGYLYSPIGFSNGLNSLLSLHFVLFSSFTHSHSLSKHRYPRNYHFPFLNIDVSIETPYYGMKMSDRTQRRLYRATFPFLCDPKSYTLHPAQTPTLHLANYLAKTWSVNAGPLLDKLISAVDQARVVCEIAR
jgi:hypothetical protein